MQLFPYVVPLGVVAPLGVVDDAEGVDGENGGPPGRRGEEDAVEIAAAAGVLGVPPL